MKRHAHRGAATTTILIVIISIAALAAAGYVIRRNMSDGNEPQTMDRFEVRTGSFDITIPASGELAALRQTEISSQLERRATITSIVDEGILVKKGDVLLTLEDEEIRNQVKDLLVDVKSAETAWTSAQSNLQIRIDANRSELALADVEIKLATLALKAWDSGTDVSKRKELALELETARKDYDRVVARFEASKDLLANQFISQDEYDRDEIEMIRAKSRFEQAQLAQQVYEDYTREQEREQLLANLKKATDKRAEIAARQKNEIAVLENEVATRLVLLERERERHTKAERQLEYCTIKAPQDGLVVYASSLDSGSWRRGNDESPPTIGSELSRNRTVMVLPDTSTMVAEVKVNEALSGRIEPGQRAVLFSDAVPEAALHGSVLSVGVLAETGGWRDPNRRDYTVRIQLDGNNELGLKPSMRCRADIYVGRVEDAIYVPVQAVFRSGPVAFAYTPDGRGFAQREVQLGRASELYIEVDDGLEEGDVVLLREPPLERVTSALDVTARNSGVWGNGASGGRGAAPATAGRPGAPSEGGAAAGATGGRPGGSGVSDAGRGGGAERAGRGREGRPGGRPAGARGGGGAGAGAGAAGAAGAEGAPASADATGAAAGGG